MPPPPGTGCPTFATVSPSLRWDSAEPLAEAPTAAPTAAPTPDPLPDPIARFTLPPEPEFHESKATHDAAYKAWTTAYDTLAQAIHQRAQARAQLHNSLFPFEDTQVRKEDQDDLEYDPQIAWRVQALQQQQESNPA